MITKAKATQLAKRLKINLDIITPEQWKKALETEAEHGSKISDKTNISHDSLTITGLIAMAHLIEDPHYYIRLDKMEEESKKYWKNKRKPNIFIK
jgi:hypothetical protein